MKVSNFGFLKKEKKDRGNFLIKVSFTIIPVVLYLLNGRTDDFDKMSPLSYVVIRTVGIYTNFKLKYNLMKCYKIQQHSRFMCLTESRGLRLLHLFPLKIQYEEIISRLNLA